MAWFHLLVNDERACGFEELNRNNSKKNSFSLLRMLIFEHVISVKACVATPSELSSCTSV